MSHSSWNRAPKPFPENPPNPFQNLSNPRISKLPLAIKWLFAPLSITFPITNVVAHFALIVYAHHYYTHQLICVQIDEYTRTKDSVTIESIAV